LKSRKVLLAVAVAVVCALGLVFADAAQAQCGSGFGFSFGPSYGCGSGYGGYGGGYHPPYPHIDRQFHADRLHWTPGRGLHLDGHYDNVPHW